MFKTLSFMLKEQEIPRHQPKGTKQSKNKKKLSSLVQTTDSQLGLRTGKYDTLNSVQSYFHFGLLTNQ